MINTTPEQTYFRFSLLQEQEQEQEQEPQKPDVLAGYVYSIDLARGTPETAGLMREAISNDNKSTNRCCACAAWSNQNCLKKERLH